jgi:imidazolonepropionase-like amidohydrolase
MTDRRRAWNALAAPAGLAALLLFWPVSPARAQAGVGTAGTFLIRGGSVWTPNGQLMQADVLIRDGRIESVGSLGPVAGAQEIDARGKRVYPGMWDSFTPVGLTEIGGIATMNMRSEIGDFNPNDRAIVAINVESEMIAITRSTGVTNVITAPGGGIMSGQAAALHMAGWTWEDMAASASAAFIINYPRAGGGGRGGGGFTPSPEQARSAGERATQQLNSLKDMIRTARVYDEARSAGSQDFDLKLESMRPLVRGDELALIAADREEEILGAIALADSFGLKIAIQGGGEAWKVADLLAGKNVPVVLGSLQSVPAADAPYDALYAQPGVLYRAGVKIAFSTGAAANARHVPYHAALAAAYGLPAEAAMNALTIWPAEIFGVGDQLGSVEAGKIANLFIADGDPLDLRTHVSTILIKGRLVPLDDRHTRLYEKWNGRPKGGG